MFTFLRCLNDSFYINLLGFFCCCLDVSSILFPNSFAFLLVLYVLSVLRFPPSLARAVPVRVSPSLKRTVQKRVPPSLARTVPKHCLFCVFPLVLHVLCQCAFPLVLHVLCKSAFPLVLHVLYLSLTRFRSKNRVFEPL